MEKKSTSKKASKPEKAEQPEKIEKKEKSSKEKSGKASTKAPSRRANGTGFFFEFNPGQTKLLHDLANEFADILTLETVMRGDIPNCRYATEDPALEAYITFELEKLAKRQQELELLLGES